MISIYITFPTKEEAVKLSKLLLDRKLIACSNISQVDSLYVWEEALCNESEWVVRMKSRDTLWNEIVKIVEEEHSYDVPCILKYSIEPNEKYKHWVFEQTQ